MHAMFCSHSSVACVSMVRITWVACARRSVVTMHLTHNTFVRLTNTLPSEPQGVLATQIILAFWTTRTPFSLPNPKQMTTLPQVSTLHRHATPHIRPRKVSACKRAVGRFRTYFMQWVARYLARETSNSGRSIVVDRVVVSEEFFYAVGTSGKGTRVVWCGARCGLGRTLW